MTLLTDDEHKRLKELCEKATPGPWYLAEDEAEREMVILTEGRDFAHKVEIAKVDSGFSEEFQKEQDTSVELIVTLRNLASALLAEREARLAAEVEIARLERLCADLSNPDLSQRIENAAREMGARAPLPLPPKA